MISHFRRGLAAGVLASGIVGGAALADDQPHAGMLRFPDVSADQIVFVYANDLWLVPRDGGVATPLASPAGQEMFPRFSPDGASIVFQGNYDGDRDLYTISTEGGTPVRLTHHPINETPTDWHSSGILCHANGTLGLPGQQAIFRVSPEGGMPEQLPIAYGANGVLSEDGTWLAYTPMQRDARTWKRYRGGMASDVWLFNLDTRESRRMTDWEGTDTMPMWNGGVVYYLSDAGPAHRLNIWSYDVNTKKRAQITKFTEYDVKYPSIGPGENGAGEIVFQHGSALHLLDLSNNQTREVTVRIPGAKPAVRPKMVDAAQNIQAGGISSTGKRVVVEARGDIWTIPAENGAPRQLTDTSGIAERNPSWSPDGRWIVYASDESGEYNLHITQSDGKGDTRQLTDVDGTFWFGLSWSPSSEKLAATDKTGRIYLIDIESGESKVVDRDEWANQPTVSWSGDSRWLAYDKTGETMVSGAIWIYDTEEDQTHQVTSGFFIDAGPVFARDGKHLFYVSLREFTTPQYDDLGSTFVYANTQRLIAVPLTSEIENPRLLESDEETWEEEEADEESDEASEEDAEEGDEGAADEEEADVVSPLVGTWDANVKGLSALGLPEDEMQSSMYFKQLEDGSFVGASEAMGEVSDYDSVTFDEETGEFVATGSEGPMSSKIVGTLNGETISGTWTISLAGQEFSGTWEATRTSEEVPDGKISDDAGSGSSDDPVEIDFENFEMRGFQVPVPAGRFGNLVSNDKGHILYSRAGAPGTPPSVKLIDLSDDDPQEKTVITGAGLADISGDGKKILLAGPGNRWKIADASAGQSMSGALTPSGLNKHLDPKAEWKQLFTDAWRRHRDFFYVSNLHGVDWDAVYEQYAAMVDDAASREDVSFIIGEMISELNVGHAYYWGGDVESQPSKSVGLLAADFALGTETGEDGSDVSAYRIAKLYHGAPWDTDARNPLMSQGMDVKEGTYITHVNGVRINTSVDPWAAFIGTTGKATTITFADALVGDDETKNVREYTVKPLGSDQPQRYRAWVEGNRQYIDDASDGKIGYIYVPNTGVQGQNELFRQFLAQLDKEALIIDDRWNGGGQIPNRFIELLDRPRTNYWARRDGKDWVWPYDSHQGPKAMLINGMAGSGGDMFPWLFRKHGLGPLIGTRTWGGLVGISNVPSLIDGGYTAVPNFGFYETDGTWGVEGHGVDPDIEVIDDPTKLSNGIDPQIDRAVEHLLAEIKRRPYRAPDRPELPDRSGMGIPERDR